jgi:hypothetical protein
MPKKLLPEQRQFDVTGMASQDYHRVFLKTMFDTIVENDMDCFYYDNPDGIDFYTMQTKVSVGRATVNRSEYMTQITEFEQLWQYYTQTGTKTFTHLYNQNFLNNFLQKMLIESDVRDTIAFIAHQEPNTTMELTQWLNFSEKLANQQKSLEILLNANLIHADKQTIPANNLNKSMKGSHLDDSQIHLMLEIYHNHYGLLNEFLCQIPMSTQASARLNKIIIEKLEPQNWSVFKNLPGMKAEIAHQNNDRFFENLSNQFILSFDIHRLVSHVDKKVFEYHHATDFIKNFVQIMNQNFSNHTDSLDEISYSMASDDDLLSESYLKKTPSYVNLIVRVPPGSLINKKDMQVFFLESLDYIKNTISDTQTILSKNQMIDTLEEFLPDYVKRYSLYRKINSRITRNEKETNDSDNANHNRSGFKL